MTSQLLRAIDDGIVCDFNSALGFLVMNGATRSYRINFENNFNLIVRDADINVRMEEIIIKAAKESE